MAVTLPNRRVARSEGGRIGLAIAEIRSAYFGSIAKNPRPVCAGFHPGRRFRVELNIEKAHVINQRIQGLMLRPATRTDAQKARSKERCEALRRKLDQQLSLTAVSVTRRSGPTHWGGSNDVMEEFVEPFMLKRGLPIGSGKRTPAENKRVGGSKRSDHLTTKRRTAARDFPTGKGEDDARALAKSMGFESWRPNSFDGFEFRAGDQSFIVQIRWGAAIDHGDHVHVGISAE